MSEAALNEAWRAAASRDFTRCEKRCPNVAPPQGWTREAVDASPAFRHRLTPGARCEHDQGHEGPHRNGGLIWHDPPVVIVGSSPPGSVG